MNKILSFSLLLLATLALVGCDDTSYNNKRDKEKKLIKAYIAAHDLTITKTLPTWEEFRDNPKLYYEVEGEDYFYYRLNQWDTVAIEGTDTFALSPIQSGDKVSVRYKKYTLDNSGDTISYWSTLDTSYPITFIYYSTVTSSNTMDDSDGCNAWHMAIKLMQYPGSECELIVPSTLGMSEEVDSTQPAGYRIRLGKRVLQ